MLKLIGFGADLCCSFWFAIFYPYIVSAFMNHSKLPFVRQKPIYLPYLQPTLTDEILADAEQKIGYKLPKTFVELLKLQNGGYVNYALPEQSAGNWSGIGPHFPSLTDFDWTEDEEYVSFQLNGLVPFEGDGHWYNCFDYRANSAEPQITWIDVECDNQEVLANSFDEYLSKLVLPIDLEHIIETNEPIEELIDKIKQILPITFEAPDTFAYGYPTYGGQYSGEWIFLSPNTVPYGFVRENEARYEELKHLMNSTALRYHELPANSVIINAFDADTVHKVARGFASVGYQVKPLKEYIENA